MSGTQMNGIGINNYGSIAEVLRDLADRMDTLSGLDLPLCRCVSVAIQPATGSPDDVVIDAVDTVSAALLGSPGETRKFLDGTWMRIADRTCRPVTIAVFSTVRDGASRCSSREENSRG